MRRQIRSLVTITVLMLLAGLILGFQTINIGDFTRGNDTPLGLSLGLDLQGGSHLVYQAALVDEDTGAAIAPTRDQMESLRRTIERRVNASGLGEPIIQLLGNDRLLVQLPGVQDPERAKSLIGETARLEFKRRTSAVPQPLAEEISNDDIVSITISTLGDVRAQAEAADEATAAGEAVEGQASESTDTQPEPGETGAAAQTEDNRPAIVFEFTEGGAQKFANTVDGLIASLINRPSQFALPDFLEISLEGNESLRFQVIGAGIQRIGENGNRFAVPFPQTTGDDQSGPATSLPDTVEGAQALLGDDPQAFFMEIRGTVDEDIGLTGDDLERAFPSQHSASGAPIVNLEFNSRGTRIFGEVTEDIVVNSPADQIAIFLDDDELIAPVVQAPITSGTAIIQGQNFTIERVRDIALLLESGRLPVPIELVQERDIDSILGADSLSKSVLAGFVGIGLVFLFMVLYYRLPGVVASIALVIYAALVLAVFKILPVTLTLSGVAAAILSVGMAVDANILIFERMKEELRAGRTLTSSINIGFNRAWPAIRDSNVSTLITCAILFWFSDQLGTTIVQGFAVTLAVGVLISMFSAIVVSRTLLRIIAVTPLSRMYRIFVPSNGSDLPQLQTTSSTA